MCRPVHLHLIRVATVDEFGCLFCLCWAVVVCNYRVPVTLPLFLIRELPFTNLCVAGNPLFSISLLTLFAAKISKVTIVWKVKIPVVYWSVAAYSTRRAVSERLGCTLLYKCHVTALELLGAVDGLRHRLWMAVILFIFLRLDKTKWPSTLLQLSRGKSCTTFRASLLLFCNNISQPDCPHSNRDLVNLFLTTFPIIFIIEYNIIFKWSDHFQMIFIASK